MLKLLRYSAPWIAAGVLFMSGWHYGAKSVHEEWEVTVKNEYIKRTEATEATQRAVDAVSEHYQNELSALEGSTDRVIADLRNDNKRLRIRVKTSSTGTAPSACGCISDGRAELDERDAKRILAVTQKGDAWIRALQDTIRELQANK